MSKIAVKTGILGGGRRERGLTETVFIGLSGQRDWPYAARNATKSKGTASLKFDSDPLGSPEQARAVTDLSSAKSAQRVFAPSFLDDPCARCHDRVVA